jgi:hypothetical protein
LSRASVPDRVLSMCFHPIAALLMACFMARAIVAEATAAEWRQGAGYRSRELSLSGPGRAGFTILPSAETGVHFTNWLSLARYTTNQIYLNGSGVAAGDVDGDGWCDLYFCRLDKGNILYRNLGAWKFEDVTGSAGVACPELAATGAAFADINGDKTLDLIVNSVGNGTHIFLNDGKAHFRHWTNLNIGGAGMSLALADYDGDGSLDLYVCNYRTVTLRDQPKTNFRVNIVDGKPVVALVNSEPATTPALQGRFTVTEAGGIAEHGQADCFYRNDGRGNFQMVSFTGGAFLDEKGQPLTTHPYDWGLSVIFRDFNGDGLPDLYVCNDFESVDRIWLNSGRRGFQAAPGLFLRNMSKFSMGVDIADINRDSYDDIFVLDMLPRDHVTRLTRADKSMDATPIGTVANRPQFTRNTLHLSRGDGTFAEIACLAGLDASDWAWTPIFLDVDLDGYEDLLITTGHGRDDMDIDTGLRIETTRRARNMTVADELGLRASSPKLPAPKRAFRNRGDLKFDEVGPEWGFNQVGISHGMCLADLDNDGDMDLAINNLNAAAGIYRNDTTAPRVAVTLRGVAPNTRGIGARIKVKGGATPIQTQEMICGGRYLSADENLRVFAAGASTNKLRIEVAWRSGKNTVLEAIPSNHILEIAEPGAEEVDRTDLRSDAREGSELARAYCSACHLFPEPDLLDKRTWSNHALRRMAPFLGVARLNYDSRPDGAILRRSGVFPATPLISPEDWNAISSFYQRSAPEKALPQDVRPKISLGLKNFVVKPLSYPTGKPLITLVHIDAPKARLYVGNARDRSLDVIGSNGELQRRVRLDSPPVSLTVRKEGLFLTLVGSVFPSDAENGKLVLLSESDGQFQVQTVLDNLQRPVHTSFGDLNGDNREDFVLSAFGNYLGKLSWFENLGQAKYREHLLLEKPGAIGSILADANNDGTIDLFVLMAQGRESVHLFLNRKDAGLEDSVLAEFHPVFGATHFELADLNGDGFNDLLITNGDNGEYPSPFKKYHGVRLLLNDGKNHFVETWFFPLNGAFKAIPFDSDHDGDLDIAAISFFPNYEKSPEESFVYFENDGQLNFKPFSFPESTMGRWLTMDIGDVDADGDNDIVLGAFAQGPASIPIPPALQDQWQNGPPLLILQNRLK